VLLLLSWLWHHAPRAWWYAWLPSGFELPSWHHAGTVVVVNFGLDYTPSSELLE
jgi:hypothetical protein